MKPNEMTTNEHLVFKASLHEESLAAHLHYDHDQPRRLPNTKLGLIRLHDSLHKDEGL